jgi:hypothetical protein
MSKCDSCEESISLTLQQGNKFKEKQKKQMTNEKRKRNKNVQFADLYDGPGRKDYREIGYPNVGVGLLDKMNFYELIDSTSFKESFQNMTSNSDTSVLTQQLPTTKDVIQSYYSELSDLDAKFNSVLEQYKTAQTGYTNELNKYVQNANSDSSYKNKNISLSNGKQYYINSQNVAKAFSTDTVYTNTQGKNNCPAGITKIGVNTLPNTVSSGTNMISGQSCGNEGISIHVASVNSKPQTNFIGCYKDSDSAQTMTSLSNGNTIYDYDSCMKLAADNNSPYFALENMNATTGLAKCNIGSNLSSIQQYGIAYNVEIITAWTTGTQGTGPNTMILNNDGSFALKNLNQQNVWSSNTTISACVNGGMIKPNSFSGTYGINCVSSGYRVNANNASNTLNRQFGSTPKSSWSFGINNSNYGDPASGCYKNFSASYTCGDNSVKTVSGWEGKTSVFDCNSNTTACVFYILLNDNGNLCLFQGTPTSNTKDSYWCSNTITQNTKINPDWVAQKGKYGTNYVKMGQTLSPGEWIGSPSGTAKLMMDTDGALRIYVSTISNKTNCSKNSSGKIIGNVNTNAVYSLANNGVVSNVGKVGYINSDSQLQEYPASMISYENNYTVTNGFDSLGNTLQNGVYTNTTVEDCQNKCNSNDSCAGFVYDTTSKIGELKTQIFPNSAREPNNNKNIYSRKIKVANAISCSKQLVDVDSVMWNNYPVAANKMTLDTKCRISQELDNTQNNSNQLTAQLTDLASKIMTVVNKMKNMNVDMNKKMNVNNKSLEDYIQKYNSVKTQISSEIKIDEVTKRSVILEDKNIYLLEENYKYMMWSTLAIVGVILTIKFVKP